MREEGYPCAESSLDYRAVLEHWHCGGAGEAEGIVFCLRSAGLVVLLVVLLVAD